jgi:hypothetical protein
MPVVEDCESGLDTSSMIKQEIPEDETAETTESEIQSEEPAGE